MKIQVGQKLRYQKSFPQREKEIDGLLNWTHLVSRKFSGKMPLMERGITPVSRFDNLTHPIPAIIIASSPTNKGNEGNPWFDYFDSDSGVVEFYGDNKTAGKLEGLGNKALLQQATLHQSGDVEARRLAAPILLFERRKKGQVVFQGFGVIESVELVTQHSLASGYFPNYRFTFAVLSMSAEAEEFDWAWIDSRRLAEEENKHHEALAPKAWSEWVRQGHSSLSILRRVVRTRPTVPKSIQLPISGSAERRLLSSVYDHYKSDHKQAEFEHLALEIVNHILTESGMLIGKCWVTNRSNDRGIDFITSFFIGKGPFAFPVGVIGQAKCEDPDKPTGGIHLSRTVARLQRGWIGAYVTTSYFSDKSQIEVIEDQYPLMLIGGAQVARVIGEFISDAGQTASEFLRDLDAREKHVRNLSVSRINMYRDL